jgi:3-hydroxybutyryl-CoA dehydrogenase
MAASPQAEGMEQRAVGIVGAGLMGHAIAYLFAQSGFRVRVQDPSAASLESLPMRVARICELLGSDPETVLSRIRCETDLASAVEGTELVIEAAPEKLAVKQAVFAELERHAPPAAILASNTSVIPISAISERLRLKHRVVGAHFWNPPHLVPLVEVVMMREENRAAAEALIALLRSMGRHPVLVQRDIPGFIGNRLQHALKREAIALVAAGICDAETIDEVVRFGFGARMAVLGPLEQSDLVGLDLTQQIHDILMPELDVTPHTHPYLAERVAHGELGMKSGQGFRHWTSESSQAVRDRLAQFLAQSALSAAADQANRRKE